MNEQLSLKERGLAAHQIYKKSMRHADKWGFIAFFVTGFIFAAAKREFGIDIGDLWEGLLILICCMAPQFLLHLRAKRVLRDAGLPYQTRRETEIVLRTTSNVIGRWMESPRINDILTKTFVGLGYFVVGVFSLASFFATNGETQRQFPAMFYLCGVAGCFLGAIWYFLNVHLPTLRIDDRGVFGYVFIFIPRLVRWEKIHAVYFAHSYDPLKGVENTVVHLKNANDKELFSFSIGSGRRAEQFIEQIKFRLIDKAPDKTSFV